MKLILTLRLIENLRRLACGKPIPYSSLSPNLATDLVNEGLLDIIHQRSRRYLHTHNVDALIGALPRYNEALKDLEAAKALVIDDNSRAAQASLSGNSKTISRRTCPGFLVNTYKRLDCTLCNRPFSIEPAEGSAVYIAEWESFTPPASAIIVGVENMENFFNIRSQKDLFSRYVNREDAQFLFVSRYAFSSDISRWLSRLPNRYIHFGDFDLAGIGIFLTQFKPYLGERGSFLIPSDVEQRIKRGSRKRYDEQYQKYSGLASEDPEIARLISIIHKYRRTYDQEGYIRDLGCAT